MIEVTELCKDYLVKGPKRRLFDLGGSKERKRAVDHISFTIHPGELVGYIGPNGAGKSTTIKMLTGILLPDGGSVRVDGLDPLPPAKGKLPQYGRAFRPALPAMVASAPGRYLPAVKASV